MERNFRKISDFATLLLLVSALVVLSPAVGFLIAGEQVLHDSLQQDSTEQKSVDDNQNEQAGEQSDEEESEQAGEQSDEQDGEQSDEQVEQDNEQSLQPDLPPFAVWQFNSSEGGEPSGIYRLAFSPDGNLLATRDQRNRVSIFDVRTHKKLCEVESHEPWVTSVMFSPDSRYFLCSARNEDSKVRAFSTLTGKLEVEFGRDILQIAFSRDGTKVHGVSKTRVETFSWPDGNLLHSREWTKGSERPLAMSDDGKLVARYSGNQRNQPFEVSVYNVEDKSVVNLGTLELTPKSAAFSPNQVWLAVAFHREQNVMLWDLRDPHASVQTLKGHDATVQAVCFSDDNRFLITTGWDNKVILRDLLTGLDIATLPGHREHVNAAAFSSVRFLFATGASGRTDNSVIVRDLRQILFPEKRLPPAFDSFEYVWRELGSEFPEPALAAIDSILRRDGNWAAELDERISEFLVEASNEKITELIAQLNSRRFADRESATEQLQAMRAAAEQQLRIALANPPSAEVRIRLKFVLSQAVNRPKIDPELLRRLHRAIFALELAGTEEAVATLKKIAGGHPSIDISIDAADSLKRLELRRVAED